MARIDFRDFQRLEDTDSLEEVITNAWDSIDVRDLKALVLSMPRRYISVIEKQGEILQSSECVSLWRDGPKKKVRAILVRANLLRYSCFDIILGRVCGRLCFWS